MEPHALLAGMQISTTVENSVEAPQKTKNRTVVAIPLLGIYSKK
jgi:hypothetical protein